MYDNFRIKFVSAPCGAGKTFALTETISRNKHFKNHLIVVPSLDLADQAYNELIEKKVKNVRRIHSKTVDGGVKSCIVNYLKNCSSEGNVLIITWQAFDDLPYFENKCNWDIYIDEIPQLYNIFKINISENSSFIKNFTNIDKEINSDLYKIKIKDKCRGSLEKIIKSEDSAYENFKPFYRNLLSRNRDTYISSQDWEKNVLGKNKKINNGDISFLSILNPNQFDKTTIMGANFEESLLFKHFKAFYSVEFVKKSNFYKNLRYTTHKGILDNRVKIFYFLENKNYSKYRRDSSFRDQTVGEKMNYICCDFFKNEKFLYILNNDYKSEVLEDNDKAIKISVKSNGLNKYINYENIYINAALNPDENSIALLSSIGITRDQIRISNTFETFYQAVMRTALRDPSSNKIVKIVVPDKFSANHLAQSLGANSLTKIEGLETTEALPALTGGQKNQRCNFQKKKSQILCPTDKLSSLNNKEVASDITNSLPIPIYTYKGSSNNFVNISEIDNKSHIAFTIHNDIYSKESCDFHIYASTQSDFLKLLKSSSKTVIDEKKESLLLNSSIFYLSNNLDGIRRQENFIQSHFMILDFDNGDLSPEDFEKIFYNKNIPEDRKCFVICNSFSRCDQKPNNFRVFMFYKMPVKSIEQHQTVFDEIVRTIENHGYNPKTCGLDRGCRTGIQSFYLPCINRKYQDYSFFKKIGLRNIKNINKYGIDVDLIYKTRNKYCNSTNYINTEMHFISEDNINEKIISIINKVKAMNENRHIPFYIAALELLKLGLSLSEIEYYCYDIAGSEKKMKKKVPGIMNSLKQVQRSTYHNNYLSNNVSIEGNKSANQDNII